MLTPVVFGALLQGDGASGVAMAIGVGIFAAIVVPALVVGRWLWGRAARGQAPRWLVPLGVVGGLAAGVYLAFFVIFGDLGASYLAQRAAPVIEVQVPQEAQGSLYLFFDPALPPLAPAGPRRYAIQLPASGQAVYGPIEEMERVMDYADLQLRYPDGTVPSQAFLPSRQGSIGGVRYFRFFIGTDAQAQADAAQREAAGHVFDEDSVFRALTGKGPRGP
jgi:hypothetical protein